MSKLNLSKEVNLNYLAKIVEIKDFYKHPNPKCEKLKCCTVDGYSISVSIDTAPGTYIYFPIECQITSSFLAVNNLFRDKEMNVDKEQRGFFESTGRVKIIKLQGYPSEGFIIPITSLYVWLSKMGVTEHIENLQAGVEFDSVGTLLLCKKYEIKTPSSKSQANLQGKQSEGLNKLIEGQFRYHYDTVLLKKCPYVISPMDIIQITEKIHGTSGISAYVLCKQDLNLRQRIARWLTKEQFNKYDYLYSSRSVVKNKFYNKNVTPGFYNCDVWKEADDIVRPKLTKGLTVYYEIVGYLPTGKYVQKDYDYGCVPPDDTYEHEKNFKVRVYRVTYTNPDGVVYEFSAKQVQQWCAQVGLTPVTEYYYGYAYNLYPELSITENWHENFLKKLCEDKTMHMEQRSPCCSNNVPHEGIVLKIENSLSQAYKVKCIRFLEKESKQLDKGESNIENES